MNIFNKYEAVGISISILVMVLALAVIRFETGALTESAPSGDTQVGLVAVPDSETRDRTSDLRADLEQAFSSNGTLVDLVIDDIRVGDGAVVAQGDTVTVHYIGTTQDGVKFDSSYERNGPFTFTVGAGSVIEGWEQGLIGMREGGERILVIPSKLAYGERSVGPIPSGATLVFAIELLSIEP